MLKNRKFWLFLISLASIIVLSILGKETSAIIGLFSVYCVGNVGSKFAITNKKENSYENTGHL